MLFCLPRFQKGLGMLIRLTVIAACLAWGVCSAKAGSLDDAEFERRHSLLQPNEEEPWRTIPWKISVLDAQRASIEEGKPIFIWAMDGHPLGCT